METKLQKKVRRLVKLTVRLAALEIFATMLAKMAIVWATVVLLGGFVSTLSSKDFRIIAVLVLIEGLRMFFKSHELSVHERCLKLQNKRGKRRQRMEQLKRSDHLQLIFIFYMVITKVPILELLWDYLSPGNFLLMQLKSLQWNSTVASFGLAVYRLSRRHVSDQQNFVEAVKVFYSLIVIETSIFIVVTYGRDLLVPTVIILEFWATEIKEKYVHALFLRMLATFVGAIYASSSEGTQIYKKFTVYVAEELPRLNNFADQQGSLVLLRALCSARAKAKARIATKDFITYLFNLMTMKYPRGIRQGAILLVSDLAQDQEALETIRLVASDEKRVRLIINVYPVDEQLDLLKILAGGSDEELDVAVDMFQVKLEVSKHGFEFLTNFLRSEDATKSKLAKQTLLSLHWFSWEGETVLYDIRIRELFNIFLKEGLLGAGEVLSHISEFPWHKKMLQKLLGEGDGERLQKLLEFVLDRSRGYYSMRILNNVCAGGNHHPGRTELRATLDKIWQEKLVGIVNMLPDLQDRSDLFMAMTLFTSMVDSVGVPAASFSQDTKERLIEKLQSTYKQILEKIGSQTIDQVMKSGAEAAKQEPVTLKDEMRAVKSPGQCNELFLYALVHFCSKLLAQIDAASFDPLAADDKLAEYLRFISSTTPADEEQLSIVLSC